MFIVTIFMIESFCIVCTVLHKAVGAALHKSVDTDSHKTVGLGIDYVVNSHKKKHGEPLSKARYILIPEMW